MLIVLITLIALIVLIARPPRPGVIATAAPLAPQVGLDRRGDAAAFGQTAIEGIRIQCTRVG